VEKVLMIICKLFVEDVIKEKGILIKIKRLIILVFFLLLLKFGLLYFGFRFASLVKTYCLDISFCFFVGQKDFLARFEG
jgi:hypothetical protein